MEIKFQGNPVVSLVFVVVETFRIARVKCLLFRKVRFQIKFNEKSPIPERKCLQSVRFFRQVDHLFQLFFCLKENKR